jgi:hypothetical protein
MGKINQQKGGQAMKTDKQKQLVLEQLQKTPIVQVVCEKVGIHRSTFYRWKLADPKFAQAVDEALDQGISLMNEYAESMLISAMKDRNLTAVFYWLNHRHPAYETRVKLNGRIKHEVKELTPEQEAALDRAVRLAGFLRFEDNDETKD